MTQQEMFEFLKDHLEFDIENKPYDGKYIVLKLRNPNPSDPIPFHHDPKDYYHIIGEIPIGDPYSDY